MVNLSHTEFTDNSGSIATVFHQNSTTEMHNATFRGNLNRHAGAIYLKIAVSFRGVNLHFRDNDGFGSSIMTAIGREDADTLDSVTLLDCTFTQNGGENMIVGYAANLEIARGLFVDNLPDGIILVRNTTTSNAFIAGHFNSAPTIVHDSQFINNKVRVGYTSVILINYRS